MRSSPPLFRALSVAILLLGGACSPHSTDAPPTGTDAGAADAPVDAGNNDAVAVTDVGVDLGAPDVGAPDVGAPDVGVDAGEDAGEDAGLDAGEDVGVDAGFDAGFDAGADVPVDAGPDVPSPLACRSDRECSGRAQVCDTVGGMCVDCNANADCNGTDVCAGHLCVTAPPTCRSSRECSSRNQVCNTVRMMCVDCVGNNDCPIGQACASDGTCATPVCTPGALSCADDSTARVCAADGLSYVSTPCPAVPNGASRCGAGTCAATCNPGFADCDGSAANGCEVDLRVTTTSCGACNNVCPSAGGTPGCGGGVCSLVCSPGRANCNAVASDGCEAVLATSNTDCGSCGHACTLGLTCVGGACILSGCPTGQTLCSGACVNLNTSVSQCGACGRACSLPNATPTCSGGACVIASCNAGFADCDGNPANGCEANLTSNATCGVCANSCAPGTACGNSGGTLGCLCSGGTVNCSGICTDLQTNAANCGACGHACAAGQACNAGACVTSCLSTETLCGGTCRDLHNDGNNCGTCGHACPTGQFCSASACVPPTLLFDLTWNVTADLDLHVVTPAAHLIYYGARTSDGGTLVADSMTTGPEQVYWATTPATGTYSVCAIPYRVDSGATTYTLRIYRAGALVMTRTGSYSAAAPVGERCSATSTYKILDYVY